MVTVHLEKADRVFLEKLGKRVRKIILDERGYSSLDAFALENHEGIAKPTLYQICDGKRDMKMSTLRRLATALGLPLEELIKNL